MKVWKSPVFYFGILLVIAITGLLSAPFVVDWNAYRADLEHYGKTLTGRAVKIDGPVTVRLFPWPRLTAEKVSIANPPGLDQKVFATADRIVVRITLAGLIGGSFNVESVDVEAQTSFDSYPGGKRNHDLVVTGDVRADHAGERWLSVLCRRG